MTVGEPVPQRRVISEPRLVLLALLAVAVGMLCIVALADTGDIWIIAVTIAAIVLIVILIAIDLMRVMDSSKDE